MFNLGRAHLKAVALLIGIKNVDFEPQKSGSGRRASIFTIPQRGTLAQNFDNRREVVEAYEDPTDLDGTTGLPIKKERVLKADQFIAFAVRLTNTKPGLLNTDFKNYIRNIGKQIYDGQTASALKPDGSTDTDVTGNIIKIELGAFNFNDNRFYGNFPNKCIIEVGFRGGIYLDPDRVPARQSVPGSWTTPEAVLT